MAELKVLYTLKNTDIFKSEQSRIPYEKSKVLNAILNNGEDFEKLKNLKYFIKPKLSSYPLNLNVSFKDYKFRKESYFNVNMKKTEYFLMKNNGRSLLRNANKQVICTSKNALRTIMETPYKMKLSVDSNWVIRAMKFDNVIYLAYQKTNTTQRTEHETYHCKFQQHCFSNNPFTAPKTDDPIDENIEVSCFFHKSIGDFDLFYSGQIAGIESTEEIREICNEESLQKCRFVATKLIKEPVRPGHSWTTHPKLLHWWIQSFLGAEEDIYCGLKTSAGFINSEVKLLKYQDIPKNQKWKPEVCRRFLCNFLTKVKNEMSMVNCPNTIFEFKYESKLKLIKYQILEGETKEAFLSNEFIKYMQMA